MKCKKYPLLVMAAIIEDKGKFLITQRLKEQYNGERWEFPGGTVEFGEDPRYALEREIEEELNIKVEADDILELSSHVYDEEKHVILIGCHCKFKEGKIKKKEIKDYKWVKPKDMMEYDITEADLPFIKRLLEVN